MQKVYNKENTERKNIQRWIHPWNKTDFNDLYDKDDRFFSIILKGALGFLNKNIVMYDKPINHFIFNTGSSYLYVESNGYKFSWKETSGEDQMYMKMPRCIVTLGDISFPTEELSNPYSRGIYERLNGNVIQGFNAEIKRIPIVWQLNLQYVLSTFNESIVLVQELINNLIYQKYYTVSYLGQNISCSLEFPSSLPIELNKIDMASAETRQTLINISLNLNAEYPLINERSEIPVNRVIKSFGGDLPENPENIGYFKEDEKWHPKDSYSSYFIKSGEDEWTYTGDNDPSYWKPNAEDGEFSYKDGSYVFNPYPKKIAANSIEINMASAYGDIMTDYEHYYVK